MKRGLLATLTGLLVGSVATYFLLSSAESSAPLEPESHPESSIRPTLRGIRIDSATRARIGLEVEALPSARLQPETKAYGQILDPSLLVARVFERASAKAAQASSEAEYLRVQGLYRGDRNASARALEAARAARVRDRATLETAQARLISAIGPTLAARRDLDRLARTLARGESALARVDVPAGESLGSPVKAGQLQVSLGEGKPLEVKFLGKAPDTDPVLQGHGFLFRVTAHPPAPGTAVVAWLRSSGPPRQGVRIPRSALVRHAGRTFVYLETAPDYFERRAVKLEQPSSAGPFVSHGLAAGDRVVVTAAQELLSSELLPQFATPPEEEDD